VSTAETATSPLRLASSRVALPHLLALLLLLIGVARIVSTYGVFSQAYDEPAHLACGMEWLDKGTFSLEPIHPPLPRVLAALGPYLAGLRLPQVQVQRDERGDSFSIYPAGNEILSTGNQYRRNVELMRVGMLPLFLIATAVVFYWGRSLMGAWGAVVAVLLFTTIPSVLAFAGLAYVDFSLVAFLPATLFAFTRWLDAPGWRTSLLLGFFAALALLSNLTTLVFLPPCLMAILAANYLLQRRTEAAAALERTPWHWTKLAALAVVIAFFVIWAGYRFSVERLDQVFGKPEHDLQAAHLPCPVRWVALKTVKLNPVVPAPDFIKGLAGNIRIGKKGYTSYLLGHIQKGGRWYFYPVVLLLKAPLPLLVLSMIGAAFSWRQRRAPDGWKIAVAPLSASIILLCSLPLKVNLGLRHILFILPLLALTAAYGFTELWKVRARSPKIIPALLGLLVLWQVAASAWAHPDYISYVNELGGRHPENKILYGCDFDCGQDLYRLQQALRERGIDNLHLRIWTSADLDHMNLPHFDTLTANQPVTGWVAASVLYLKMGDAVWDPKLTTAYSWLSAYKPEAYVGKTIRLYRIPERTVPQASK
jgi:hypothetical protein